MGTIIKQKIAPEPKKPTSPKIKKASKYKRGVKNAENPIISNVTKIALEQGKTVGSKLLNAKNNNKEKAYFITLW